MCFKIKGYHSSVSNVCVCDCIKLNLDLSVSKFVLADSSYTVKAATFVIIDCKGEHTRPTAL